MDLALRPAWSRRSLDSLTPTRLLEAFLGGSVRSETNRTDQASTPVSDGDLLASFLTEALSPLPWRPPLTLTTPPRPALAFPAPPPLPKIGPRTSSNTEAPPRAVEAPSPEGAAFWLQLDVSTFSPAEIGVRVSSQVVEVTARHDSTQPSSSGLLSRRVRKRFPLPPHADPMTLTATITPSGTLTLRADPRSTLNQQDSSAVSSSHTVISNSIAQTTRATNTHSSTFTPLANTPSTQLKPSVSNSSNHTHTAKSVIHSSQSAQTLMQTPHTSYATLHLAHTSGDLMHNGRAPNNSSSIIHSSLQRTIPQATSLVTTIPTAQTVSLSQNSAQIPPMNSSRLNSKSYPSFNPSPSVSNTHNLQGHPYFSQPSSVSTPQNLQGNPSFNKQSSIHTVVSLTSPHTSSAPLSHTPTSHTQQSQPGSSANTPLVSRYSPSLHHLPTLSHQMGFHTTNSMQAMAAKSHGMPISTSKVSFTDQQSGNPTSITTLTQPAQHGYGAQNSRSLSSIPSAYCLATTPQPFIPSNPRTTIIFPSGLQGIPRSQMSPHPSTPHPLHAQSVITSPSTLSPNATSPNVHPPTPHPFPAISTTTMPHIHAGTTPLPLRPPPTKHQTLAFPAHSVQPLMSAGHRSTTQAPTSFSLTIPQTNSQHNQNLNH
uniref:SHSP domain-containing protein n=1 Tax=Eptatretus burgeri TaxID=7764 RepID=A0A8C4Q3C5_EPTBU